MAFKKLFRAALSTHVSSASAERFVGDLGQIEDRYYQSTLTSKVEMKKIILVYVNMRLKDISTSQSSLLHPQGTAFRRIATEMAQKVFEGL